MIIFAAFFLCKTTLRFLSCWYIISRLLCGQYQLLDVEGEDFYSLSKPSLVEVSAFGGVMVRAWDHVSYSAFFFYCRSFQLQLAPLVLASMIPSEGEVLAKADCSPNCRLWPGPGYESHSNKNVIQIPRFHQTKTEGQMSCHRVRQTTLADHSVFFPLKFYLNMSCVR